MSLFTKVIYEGMYALNIEIAFQNGIYMTTFPTAKLMVQMNFLRLVELQ